MNEEMNNMLNADELTSLKEEVQALNDKLAELTEEELEQVAGGMDHQNDHSSEQWKDLLLYLLKTS